MWIDSHAHLFDYSTASLANVVHEAAEFSVSSILSTATNLENSLSVIAQCAFFDTVYGAVGISPFDVENQEADWFLTLQKLALTPKIIAIGEIGIDKTNPRYPPYEIQLEFFKQQLDLARTLNLTAVIHSRGAEEEALEICQAHKIRKAVFHCFTGSAPVALEIQEAGYYLSFSGIITFRNAPIRDYIADLSIHRLLIETDTPYLAPVPFRGKENRPALIKYTGEELARLLDTDAQVLQNHLEDNFKKLFFKDNL